MTDEVTLKLILTVTYRPKGESLETLRGLLFDLADRAAGDGMLTGATMAETDGWESDVQVVHG